MSQKYLPHQQRVIDEKSELDDKREALKTFMGTSVFQDLPFVDKVHLDEQYRIMDKYTAILTDRIKRF